MTVKQKNVQPVKRIISVSSLANDLHMRTCLIHPDEIASFWTGHIHLYEDLTIFVGWCKDCHKHEIASEIEGESNCEGCFGKIGGLR